MKSRFRSGAALVASILLVSQATATILIDNFGTLQGPVFRTAPGDVGVPIGATIIGGGIIGTERDIRVDLISTTPAGSRITVSVASYNHSQDAGIRGTSRCVWDGADGDGIAINHTGLGGVDLTDSGAQDALEVHVISADLMSTIVFEVFTDAGNSSSYLLNLVGGAFNDIYVIPYASFITNLGAGADFTNVGAISMFVDGSTVPSLDVIVDLIQTTSLVTMEKTDAHFVDSDGDGNVDVGETIQYTITITNPDDDGNSAAPAVIFTDTPDPSTSLVVGSVTTTQGSVTTGNTGGDTTVEVNVGNVADGATVTITFTVTVTAEDPLVCNQGFIDDLPSDDPGTPDENDPTCTPVTFCGDGIVNDVTEECDDGNLNDNDDCSNNCTMGCGNDIINTGEFCDGLAEAPAVDCTLPCRDELAADPCTCCGDAVLQPGSGEQCDGVAFEPGAPASHGPCRNDCTFCGDGLVNGGEECDDGNADDNDDCSNNCTMGCGNEIINTGESCDGVAEAPGVDCTLPCRTSGGLDECTCCGDDLLQPGSGEQCDGTLFEPGAPASHGPCRNDCTFCGDGLVNGGEECDDGNDNDNDACSNNCTMGCGNNIVNTGEFCDGAAEAPGVDCTLPCRTAPPQDSCTCCGDDVLQASAGEQCDGVIFEPGAPATHGPCRNDCTFCGDGAVNGGEECDDGNAVDNDGCTNACTNPRCGDGIVQAPEECDDGNLVNNDACTNACTTPRCGDGIVQAGEQCDDGNQIDGDGCQANCQNPRCGDGIVDPGEGCDDGNLINNDGCTNACTLPDCGDGIVQPGEQCDDGNAVDNDGCSNVCMLPRCGDGIVQAGEQCDDGNAVNNDACTNACTTPRCGDGIVQPGEECDDGDFDNNDACTNACTLPECGDGFLQPGELCDDGNNIAGDGCSPICRPEFCGNNVLDPGEECDGTADANCAPTEVCGPDCVCGERPPDTEIPTVSEWGLVILALLLLTGAKVYYSSNRFGVGEA